MKTLPSPLDPIVIKKNIPEYKPMLVLPPKNNKDIVHYLESYENIPTFDVWA